VSLFETALHELMYIGPWAATHGYVPPRRRNSGHASIVPFQNFRAADGWLVVAAAKQKFWERLCEVLGEPELGDDPRFATMAARDEHRDELLPVLEELFARRTVQEWLDLLVPAGVPAAKVNTVLEALAEPQTKARGDIVEHEHPVLGTVRSIRTALRLEADGEPLERPSARGPFRGEHTEEVLAELCGYSPERIRELAEAGVFGEVEVPA
jgi:crotonobetainyl-CoA:carnitine CoA-transferase CaiB-like acyl-CoA transferase